MSLHTKFQISGIILSGRGAYINYVIMLWVGGGSRCQKNMPGSYESTKELQSGILPHFTELKQLAVVSRFQISQKLVFSIVEQNFKM